jgi:hypothetical protein
MKKLVTITIFSILFLSEVYSQQGMWVQTGGTPQGSGITDLLYVESTNSLFATTGWYNYPNGDPGGIRRSTDDGDTWENVKDAYIARKIIEGADGYLYASVWPYPTAEGFYRSTDNGDTWQALNAVATGNNIFSILVTATGNPYSFFIGTRNWIQRSTDYGNSWTTLNNVGIPPNSWIYDMAITNDSVLFAATSNGVYYSENNGDSWLQVSGIATEDTVVTIGLGENLTANASFGAGQEVGAGTNNGKLYTGNSVDKAFYQFFLGPILFFEEISAILTAGIIGGPFASWLLGVYGLSQGSGGGTIYAHDNSAEWINEGFPSTAPVSDLDLKRSRAQDILYAGFFENQDGGAKVYKRELVVSVERVDNQVPTKYILQQNYPNPFNPSTTISFSLPEETFVKLEVFNSIGEKISTLVSKEMNPGNYSFEWNAENYSSGVYFYRIKTGDFTAVKKLVLLK